MLAQARKRVGYKVTYLLAWNPKRWIWGDLDRELATVRRTGEASFRWSCGNNKSIRAGSRFFLIRLGDSQRGIVGSGRILSSPHRDIHWDQNRALRGEQAQYVDIVFDALHKKPLINWHELRRTPFNEFRWGIQMSGVRLPESIAAALEERWKAFNNKMFIPEEIRESSFWEGSAQKIVVNAYERDLAARAACIAYFGTTCMVCGFDFEDAYGSIAAGYIHIHHLFPISKIGKRYRVNPIKDLLPVCANCHSVIHLGKKKPFTPEEVKNLIRRKVKMRKRIHTQY